jgi:hypothetical protein
MRIFKFRIWNKVKKHWHQYGIDLFGETSLLGYIGFDAIDNKSIPLIELNDLVATQFTAMLDKYGKDIYEGDIISDEETNVNYVIKYEDCIFGGYDLDKERKLYLHGFRWQYCKVVGNIFEDVDIKHDTQVLDKFDI